MILLHRLSSARICNYSAVKWRSRLALLDHSSLKIIPEFGVSFAELLPHRFAFQYLFNQVV